MMVGPAAALALTLTLAAPAVAGSTPRLADLIDPQVPSAVAIGASVSAARDALIEGGYKFQRGSACFYRNASGITVHLSLRCGARGEITETVEFLGYSKAGTQFDATQIVGRLNQQLGAQGDCNNPMTACEWQRPPEFPNVARVTFQIESSKLRMGIWTQ
ncbi:MAG: hypothetical protein AB7P52_07510 [Alphaproteobacteria bacterium]